MEEFRIDASQGDIYTQAIDSAPGYPDQYDLKQQRDLARSGEAPVSVRDAARRHIATVAFNYGSRDIALAIDPSLEQNTAKNS